MSRVSDMRSGILTDNEQPTRDAPSMLVVPDIYEEMFCPLQDGIFVDPHNSRNLIENFLTALPDTTCTSSLSALGATMRGAVAALQRHGGQAILFTSSGCNVGPGAHVTTDGALPTDESTFYDTDKEKQLFMPKDPLWQDLGEELAESGIGVTMFVGTASSGLGGVDFGSIGLMVSFLVWLNHLIVVFRTDFNALRRLHTLLPSVFSDARYSSTCVYPLPCALQAHGL